MRFILLKFFVLFISSLCLSSTPDAWNRPTTNSSSRGNLLTEVAKKCEMDPINIFEENLQNISPARVPLLDGRFLSLAVRQDSRQIQKNQFRTLPKAFKNQVALSLGVNPATTLHAEALVENHFENLDQNLVYAFQWSHPRHPREWFQVVYFYNEDHVSGFLYVMNSSQLAARIVDGEMMICDDRVRIQ